MSAAVLMGVLKTTAKAMSDQIQALHPGASKGDKDED
jgi:hypothetical protein